MTTPLPTSFVRYALAAVFSFTLYLSSVAQAPANEQQPILPYAERMPEYEDGEKALMQLLNQTIAYTKAQPTGLVIASFVITNDGLLTDVEIIKSLDPALDQECIRAIESLPGKWLPGIQNGQQVPVKYLIPIHFAHEEAGPAKVQAWSMSSNNAFVMVEKMPEYIEGRDALMLYIKNAVPATQAQKGVSVFSFIVDRNGTITDVSVLKPLHPATDAKIVEALQKTSGKWTAGQQFGHNMKVKYTLAVQHPITTSGQPNGAKTSRKSKSK